MTRIENADERGSDKYRSGLLSDPRKSVANPRHPRAIALSLRERLAPLEGGVREAAGHLRFGGRAVRRLLRVGRQVVQLRPRLVGVHQELPVAVPDRHVRRAVLPGWVGEGFVVPAVFPEQRLRAPRTLAEERRAQVLAVRRVSLRGFGPAERTQGREQ